MKIHIIDLGFLNEADTIAAFLIETASSPVLIETGPYSTFAHLQAGVKKIGFELEEIQHVLLSHIHLDHAGAAWAMAAKGANIYLHPFGAKNMADPSKLMESARRIYQDQMDRLWGDMRAIPENQLKIVGNQEVISVGDVNFVAHHTPGHASHHIAWQVDDVVFTGDVAGVAIQNGPVVAPLPPPDIDIEQWLNSIQLLSNLKASKFYLTHFGEITEIDSHLQKLEANIWLQANWVKAHWEAGESIEEMTPAFDAYCQDDLLAKGLPKSELLKYQAANPAWMSVAGLVRYWKKKGESVG